MSVDGEEGVREEEGGDKPAEEERAVALARAAKRKRLMDEMILLAFILNIINMSKIYRSKTEPTANRVNEGFSVSWALVPGQQSAPDIRSTTEHKIKLPKIKQVDLSDVEK